jgi:hypothetical protein
VSLDVLPTGERANATLGWTVVGVVALVATEAFLSGEFLWGGLSLLVAVAAAVPALATRDRTAVVPWPLLSVAGAAVVARAAGAYPEVAGYLVVATLALLVVVELDTFTPVEFSRRFAIVFGVLTTLAVEALWVVAQFYSDRWFGTRFLRSQTELQWDIVAVTTAGCAVGVLFYWYLDRFGPPGIADRSTHRTGTR